jgi:hypothetical protein
MSCVYLFNGSGVCFSITSEMPESMVLELVEKTGALDYVVSDLEVPIEKARLIDGELVSVEPQVSAEVQWSKIRSERTLLLIFSDWTDLLSSRERLGEELYGSWQAYRQALREITEQQDPFNIVWPSKP